MTWFLRLTGLRDETAELVRTQLSIQGDRLFSQANGKSWRCGTLTTPTLAELRQALPTDSPQKITTVSEVVANVQSLHADVRNAGALFQVASQFNLLEMVSPYVSPSAGVGIYEQDHTQGPACAIAAGAGTIYRNYFVPIAEQLGQTSQRQIDCLADVGKRLENDQHKLWQMQNGYMLPPTTGLSRINKQLEQLTPLELDELRGALRIGLHTNTEVTLSGCSHVVTQAFCSAVPVAYTSYAARDWAPFAKLILEAAYEATICAALINARQTNNRRAFLTLLGGGAFGNESQWIYDAIERAIGLYPRSGLEIYLVSYGRSVRDVAQLANRLTESIGVSK